MYKLRLKIFLCLMAGGVLVVIVRLAQVQLVQGKEYRRQAEELLTFGEFLPTVRGQIRDRKDRLLACDEARYDFCLDYRMLTGPGSSVADRDAYRRWKRRQIRRIARREGLSQQQAERAFPRRVQQTWRTAETITGAGRNELAQAAANVLRRVRMIRRIVGGPVLEERVPHPIVRGLDERTKVDLQVSLGGMVGASIRPSHRRWYPHGADACHVIGLLGPVGEAELRRTGGDGRRPVEEKLNRYFSDDRIGITGVEKACEDMLRGQRGYRRLHRTGGLLKEVPARPGRDVHLTIDVELQRALAGELARPGAIVVLDAPTGEVLAMVSFPRFDLNEYPRRVAELSADRVDLPLLNRAVAVCYPPASTVKPLAAAAGLATGAVRPGETIHCSGYLHSPDAFRCWIYRQHGAVHGSLEVVGAIENSCNIFFYTVGERLGLRRLNEWLGRFGFADSPGTRLPEERAGSLPDPRRHRGAGVPRMMAIGQGPIAVTPLHVANAMAAIARGGEFRSPLLVRELVDRQVRRRLDLSPEMVRLVQQGMDRVVNGPRGTARTYVRDYEIRICGKTGTGKTSPRVVDGQVVRSGDTAWFAGFAPYRDPRIAFAVVVEYSEDGGGATCGPIARNVVRTCQRFGYLD